MLLGAIALAPVWLRAPFDNALVRKVAELGYGVYLIHLVVATYVCTALLALPTDGSLRAAATWFGVVLVVSFGYAWLSLRYLEGPARPWARRSVKQRSQAPASPPSPAIRAEGGRA